MAVSTLKPFGGSPGKRCCYISLQMYSRSWREAGVGSLCSAFQSGKEATRAGKVAKRNSSVGRESQMIEHHSDSV